jgi:hypothetical protein
LTGEGTVGSSIASKKMDYLQKIGRLEENENA